MRSTKKGEANMSSTKKGEANMSSTTITPEAFVKAAIVSLRNGKYKGIHSVWSGFNDAFRLQFPELDPRVVTDDMAKRGQIVLAPTKGGVLLYLPEDAPTSSRDTRAVNARESILNALTSK